MGIRQNTIHFEQLPTKEAVKQGLYELIGVPVHFDEEIEGILGVVHPTHRKVAATIYWVDKKENALPKELDSLGANAGNKKGFIKGWSQYIIVEFEAGNIDYIEKTVLYLLKRMGGRSENESELPIWAGKKWIDIWPNSYLGKFKAKWRGWTRGTLSN